MKTSQQKFIIQYLAFLLSLVVIAFCSVEILYRDEWDMLGVIVEGHQRGEFWSSLVQLHVDHLIPVLKLMFFAAFEWNLSRVPLLYVSLACHLVTWSYLLKVIDTEVRTDHEREKNKLTNTFCFLTLLSFFFFTFLQRENTFMISGVQNFGAIMGIVIFWYYLETKPMASGLGLFFAFVNHLCWLAVVPVFFVYIVYQRLYRTRTSLAVGMSSIVLVLVGAFLYLRGHGGSSVHLGLYTVKAFLILLGTPYKFLGVGVCILSGLVMLAASVKYLLEDKLKSFQGRVLLTTLFFALLVAVGRGDQINELLMSSRYVTLFAAGWALLFTRYFFESFEQWSKGKTLATWSPRIVLLALFVSLVGNVGAAYREYTIRKPALLVSKECLREYVRKDSVPDFPCLDLIYPNPDTNKIFDRAKKWADHPLVEL